MTHTQQEIADAARLAEKHGGTVVDYSLPEGPQATDTTVIIATSGLAALIAEVRRDEREKCAQELHEVGPNAGPYAYYIRARLEEGK